MKQRVRRCPAKVAATAAQPMAHVTIDPDGVPVALRDCPQWVPWRYEQRPNSSKLAKVPLNLWTGGRGNVLDRCTWGSFSDAIEFYQSGRAAGVGFVLTKDDPFAGVDLDGCLDPDGGDPAAR